MNDINNELKKEAQKIKDGYEKNKYINKLFLRFFISLISTCIICCFFSKVNEIFDFYVNFVFTIILFACFCNFVNSTGSKVGKKNEKNNFIFYIVAIALYCIRYCDFSRINELFYKLIFLFGIFLAIMLMSKYAKKSHNFLIFFCAYIVYDFVFSGDVPVFILGICIYLCSNNYQKINKLISNSDIILEQLEEKFYVHLFKLYTLFIIMYIIIT